MPSTEQIHDEAYQRHLDKQEELDDLWCQYDALIARRAKLEGNPLMSAEKRQANEMAIRALRGQIKAFIQYVPFTD